MRRRGLDQLGFWRNLTEHPAYDAFWREQAVDKLLAKRPRMLDAPEGIGPLAIAIPEYSGILEVDYEPERWRGFGIGASVSATGPVEAKADNSVELSAYAVLDLGLRYSFSVRSTPVSVRASVTNVTDEFAAPRTWHLAPSTRLTASSPSPFVVFEFLRVLRGERSIAER